MQELSWKQTKKNQIQKLYFTKWETETEKDRQTDRLFMSV